MLLVKHDLQSNAPSVSSRADRRTAVARLLSDAKGRELPWRVVETDTGIVKATREGWFRRKEFDGHEPPLGAIAYLARYLGVEAEELIAAALADYTPPTEAAPDGQATSSGAGNDDRDEAGQGLGEAASARAARAPGPAPRRARRPRDSRP